MYYRQITYRGNISGVQKIEDTIIICIPFVPDNTDYQQFKTDIYNGIELLDPDGNVMTQEQVQKFLSTIP
jgi:hypothetical protein